MITLKNEHFSVLLSIYHKESPNNFSQAMRSIYDLQELKPDDIVLVKDGPLTPELDLEIQYWSNKLGHVLTIVPLHENVGLASALNFGLKYCKWDLVARMDTDDISTPDRFKLQVGFMSERADISVSSGYIEEWDINLSEQVSHRALPICHDEIVKFARLRSPISHPACIFRKSIILSVGGYPSLYPEDHLLWVKVIQSGNKLANIPQVILKMRTGEDFITRRGYKFLKGELSSYVAMYRSGFLNFWQLSKVSIIRTFVRLAPNFIKIGLYKWFRSV